MSILHFYCTDCKHTFCLTETEIPNIEITNTLKIKDIKQKLQENNERTIIFNSTATEQINKEELRNSTSVSKQFENIAKELLKPTYASSPEDELLKKKKRKFR